MPKAIRGEKFFKLPQTSLRSASPLLIEGAETVKNYKMQFCNRVAGKE